MLKKPVNECAETKKKVIFLFCAERFDPAAVQSGLQMLRLCGPVKNEQAGRE
jgi:hypothetical protein